MAGSQERTRDRVGRLIPDEAPEQDEPTLEDPGPSDLSGADYAAIVRRAVTSSLEHNITALAAALAYYAFLAIPSALLVALGLFTLVADPGTVTTFVDKLGTLLPEQATALLGGSLERMTEKQATGATIAGIGGLLALWSLGGAMQNLMWATNQAYERDETRGFVKRRLTAWLMLFFAGLAFVLSFGVLVLGPHLSRWLGEALGAEALVRWTWLVAQWPLVVAGLLLCFATLLYLGPNVEHRRWSFFTIGAGIAVAGWVIGSAAFSFYSSRFGSYNKTWGALASVVILLTWLWLSALALLFAAEVNAQAERSRELRSGESTDGELQAPAKA